MDTTTLFIAVWLIAGFTAGLFDYISCQHYEPATTRGHRALRRAFVLVFILGGPIGWTFALFWWYIISGKAYEPIGQHRPKRNERNPQR